MRRCVGNYRICTYFCRYRFFGKFARIVKYILRLILWSVIFFLTLSVSYVIAMRFVPVTVTPLKVVKLFENSSETPFRVRSQWRGLDNINPSLMKAVVATEDNFFLVHRGFDWTAIEKAWEYNRRNTRRRRGASTISQQTAKNVFCYPSQSWFRKGVETYYTVLIETLWSKRRIMETYLNIVELGPNVYGAEAAAEAYFRKDAAQLNVYESSMMAAVLPNPIRMKLAAPSSYVVQRSATVRSLMRNLPAVDFDDTEDVRKLYEKYKSR